MHEIGQIINSMFEKDEEGYFDVILYIYKINVIFALL